MEIFPQDADYLAFEKILGEALEIHRVELFSYHLMPNHYHLVLSPLVDGEMSRFVGWGGGTHTMRYHAHYNTSGMGHVYQQRYKSFPIQDDDQFLLVCPHAKASDAGMGGNAGFKPHNCAHLRAFHSSPFIVHSATVLVLVIDYAHRCAEHDYGST